MRDAFTGVAASSTNEFHSEQLGHLPIHRGDTYPHDWHTYLVRFLGMFIFYCDGNIPRRMKRINLLLTIKKLIYLQNFRYIGMEIKKINILTTSSEVFCHSRVRGSLMFWIPAFAGMTTQASGCSTRMRIKKTLLITQQGLPKTKLTLIYCYNFAQRAFARFTFLLIG